jgi:uncharacterized protein with ATP-grasp and redox domains
MRAEPECIPCILKDIEEAGRLILKDREKESLLLKKSTEFLTEEFNGRKTPPYYITQVHRFLKEISGLDIPFAERRSRCNDIGIDVAKEIEKELESLNGYDRFAEIVLWAVAGNTIDFRTVGSGYDSDLAAVEGKWREIHDRGLALDERKTLWEVLQKSERVLYIPDNVGELALDGLLMKFINKMDKKMIVGMRGGAITSDATMEDAKTLGIDLEADQLISTGPDTLGISSTEMSPELRDELNKADLIISKGQANFQVLTELKSPRPPLIKGEKGGFHISNCACLLTTKCDLVSSRFGFDGKVGIVKII